MSTKNTTNLFSFAVPPPRENVRVSLKKDLIAELESFHLFVREHEGEHIELGHVFEHVFENFLSSGRKEMRVYREWKDGVVASVSDSSEVLPDTVEPVSNSSEEVADEPASETKSDNAVESYRVGARTISR